MKMEIGKTYLVKNDIFGLKKDELWTLVDKGYQSYFGEHNFVFVNDDKVKVFAVLQDGSEEDICSFARWFRRRYTNIPSSGGLS